MVPAHAQLENEHSETALQSLSKALKFAQSFLSACVSVCLSVCLSVVLSAGRAFTACRLDSDFVFNLLPRNGVYRTRKKYIGPLPTYYAAIRLHSLTLTPTFCAENWHAGYSIPKNVYIKLFSNVFLFLN